MGDGGKGWEEGGGGNPGVLKCLPGSRYVAGSTLPLRHGGILLPAYRQNGCLFLHPAAGAFRPVLYRGIQIRVPYHIPGRRRDKGIAAGRRILLR